MKKAGATSVVAGVCHAGPDTGLIYTASTYPDWATYGRVFGDAEFRRVLAEFLKVVEVHDRSIIEGEEL